MKHIIIPLVCAMVLVGVLVEYGNYVSESPHLQTVAGSKSITLDQTAYNALTNPSVITSLR